MINNLKHIFIYLWVCLLVVSTISICRATSLGPNTLQDIAEQRTEFGKTSGFSSTAPPNLGGIVATVIQAFLGLLGIIFVMYIIVAGYNWMTAGGEEEKVRKAKDMIRRAIIGLIIIVAAYAITAFVFKSLGGIGGDPGP